MAIREMAKISGSELRVLERLSNSYPIRLGDIARELGVSIKVSPMVTGLSGQISREGTAYVIRVNKNEARERQRFTIAHELAHFLLHRSIIDSSPEGIEDTVLYRSGAPESMEFEANRLGAEIVMPEKLVTKTLNEKFGGVITETTIEGLSREFEVSKAAMEIRLSTLAIA